MSPLSSLLNAGQAMQRKVGGEYVTYDGERMLAVINRKGANTPRDNPINTMTGISAVIWLPKTNVTRPSKDAVITEDDGTEHVLIESARSLGTVWECECETVYGS